MKKIFLVLLCAYSSAYAGSRVLPPVVDNSIYPAGAGVGVSAPSSNVVYEILGRLEQLQIEVQQLRGVVEEQAQTIVDLKKRQGNIYSDLDLRLQELSKTSVAMSNGSTGTEIPLSSGQGDISNDVDTGVAVIKPAVIADKDRYQKAYEMLRNGHNNRAITAFNTLISDAPAGEYADNSQYWLGEAYKVNQEMDAAKAAFLKVVMNYAGSPKVPDALLKLGYIEFEFKNMAKARDYFTQITVAHPQTTAAHLASKKLLQMDEMSR